MACAISASGGGGDAASALSAAAIPLVDATGGLTVPVLVALAVLGALFDPAGLTARETLLPAAAEAAQWRLIRVNGVHEGVFGLAYLVGPGIGGVLIATSLFVMVTTAVSWRREHRPTAAHRA